MDTASSCAQPLYDAILDELRRHPTGISEFELIRALERRGGTGFRQAALAEPVALFRTHFLLFHYLYRLRATLRAGGEDLEIHCLRIKLCIAAVPAPGDLAEADPLAAYYLDLGNLEGVDADQVQELLAGFWRRFRLHGDRARALATLGLTDPVSAGEIKRQYRRLAMRHHPDRGGDTRTLQALNEAMAVLAG